MTLRLQKYFLIVGIASIVLSPLVFFSYPKQAKADTPSCALAEIGSLLRFGATAGTATAGGVTTNASGQTLNAGATAVTVPVNPVGQSLQLTGVTTVLAAQNVLQGQTAVTNTQNSFSTCILKPLMIIMAQRILANITNSLVTWIQSGFQGNPGFVTNIDDLVSQSSNEAIGHFINSTALSFLCQPFSLQVRLALATQFSAQQYSGCTLTQIDQNIQNFGNTTQAWQSWLKISTIPMNNQFGAYVQLSSQLGSQLNTRVQNINNELQRNLGFLDFKTCPGGYVVDAVDGEPGETIPSQQGSSGAYCPHLVSTTPGSVVQGAINTRFGAEYNELAVGDDINQILGALVNEMVSKTLTGAGGLLGGHTQGASNTDLTTAATTNGNEGNLSTVNTINQQVSEATNVAAGTSVSSGNINLAAGATASASSVGVGSNPANATDGDVNTTFVSSNESTPSYTLDLGTQQSWNEIDILAPYPTQTTLGQIEVEISNSSTFDPTDASTKIWDEATNAFVSAQSENPNYIFNSTTSPTFTISAPATAEFIKITKASKLALDLINTCVSGQTDSAGNCADPLQISEVEVMTNSGNSSNQTTTSGTTAALTPSVSFSGNPTTGSITLNTNANAPSDYSLSISTSDTIATPISAFVTLMPSSGGFSGNNSFDYESLTRTNNGQSANIDLNNSLINTGALPLSNIQLPMQINLAIEAKSGSSGAYSFVVDLKDANGVDLGTNTETFVILP